MELQFRETTVKAWQDLMSLTKTIPLAMESVVPDTREDIGRILSVWPEIYLKSKELRNHGVLIEAEVQLTVFYIHEDENAVSSFSMSQGFRQEYELPGAEDKDILQLHLSIAGLQARALNPRKISVDLEIKADLSVSRDAEVVVSQALPEELAIPIHLQYTETEIALCTGICEKSFSVNEQLSFPEKDEQPSEIVGKKLRYKIREREIVSSRLLIKGEAQLTVFYAAQEMSFPRSTCFSIPFSQLIDLGDENTETAELQIVPTSDYLSLTEGIDGKKQLDVELHAIAQVRSGRKQTLRLVTDAYSNQMPCECRFVEQRMNQELRDQAVRFSCEERIDLPEEFLDLLAFYPAVGPCTEQQGSAAVELLCRSNDGKLFAMHRNLTLASNEPVHEMSNPDCELEDCHIWPDGKQLIVQMTVNGRGKTQDQIMVRRTDTLSLNEEQSYDCAAYPSLTAVWAETESVWELSKLYHSSPEAICFLNQDLGNRPLFIPKTK